MATTHIHGTTFDYVIPMPDSFADGYFVSWNVYAQIRTTKYPKLVTDLVCTWVDTVTTRDLKLFTLDTTSWPLEACEMDVKFVRKSDNYTFSSNIEPITIAKCVTQPDISL